MRKTFLVLIGIGALALSLAFSSQPCAALEKIRVYRGVLIIEGKIVPGDYTSLWNFLRDESNFKKISGGVFLASPGGYIREAMKMGWLIRQLRLSTNAPSIPPPEGRNFGDLTISASDLVNRRNYECVSACFLVYVAGIYRNLDGAGRLGVHKPKLENNLAELSKETIANAYSGMRSLIEHYFDDMNVPRKYADLMFSVPSNGLRWITQEEFDADLKGYVPPVRDWIDKRCKPRDEENRTAVLTGRGVTSLPAKPEPLVAEQSIGASTCLIHAKAELTIEAWRNLFRPN